MVEEEVKIKATLMEMPLGNDSKSGGAYQTTAEWSEGRSCTDWGDDECKNLQS